MSKLLSNILTLGLLLVLTGCVSDKDVVEEVDEKTFPVEVINLAIDANTSKIKYVGVLQPEIYREKTFTNFTVIEKIYVEEGDVVFVGDLLAKQDTTELEANVDKTYQARETAKNEEESAYQNMLAKELAYKDSKNSTSEYNAELKADMEEKESIMNTEKAEYDAVKAEYEIAEADYNTAKTEYDDAVLARDAIDQGADPDGYAAAQLIVTEKETTMDAKELVMEAKATKMNNQNAEYIQAQVDYNTAKNKYDIAIEEGVSVNTEIAEANYNASKAQYEASKSKTKMYDLAYEEAKDALDDSYMYSDIDGYVLKIISEEGEVASPLFPVMVLGSSDTIVTIGISQNDVRTIEVGMKAEISISTLDFDGEVISISKIPDESSRTYETFVSFPEDKYNFFIGESAVVDIIVGESEGIWIPINIIQNDGEDFVYIVSNDRVFKKIIRLGSIDNDFVLVEGLEAGDQLISNGIKSVKPGYLVKITNEEELNNQEVTDINENDEDYNESSGQKLEEGDADNEENY